MIIRFINVAAGTFAQPPSGVPSNGGGIVGGDAVAEWLLTPIATLGQYSIQTTDGTFACSFSDGIDFTHVRAHHVSEDNNSRQAFLPGGHRTGAPGKHVIRGVSKYRLLDEKVRVFVAPSIEEIKKSELKPYVGKDVMLTMVQKRELWNIMPKPPASSQSAPSS